MSVAVEVSYGELLDKISILEIKLAQVTDPGKRGNIDRELRSLCAARDRTIRAGAEAAELYHRLVDVNWQLWRIEDDIRERERHSDFGARFIELARSIYKLNDLRATLKGKLNGLLGSPLVEEKLYRDY